MASQELTLRLERERWSMRELGQLMKREKPKKWLDTCFESGMKFLMPGTYAIMIFTKTSIQIKQDIGSSHTHKFIYFLLSFGPLKCTSVLA